MSFVRGVSTAGVKLQSHGYMAPELLDDLARAADTRSDMFALGRSIEQVLELVADWKRESPELTELKSMTRAMISPNPSDRITAPEAADRWWTQPLSLSDGMTTQVLCNDVLYTQDHCSRVFTDGRSLEQLIDALLDDPELPLRDERLVINVVKKGLALLSLDNRRLYCFKSAQVRLPDKQIWIRVKQHQHSPIWDRYGARQQRNYYNSNNGGKYIQVRGRPR